MFSKHASRISMVSITLLSMAAPAGATIPWTQLTGSHHAGQKTPAVVDRPQSDGFNEYIDVFTIDDMNFGHNNVVWTQLYASPAAPDGVFISTTDLGGATYASPTAVGWDLHEEVLALGTDDNVYDQTIDNGVPSGWVPLLNRVPSGGFCTGPSAVSSSPGRVDVFAVGCNHVLYHNWANSGVWNYWESLGGSYAIGIGGAPALSAVANCVPYTLRIFLVGTNAHISEETYSPSTGWHVSDSGSTAAIGIYGACEYYNTVFGHTTNGTQLFAKQSAGPPWLASTFVPAPLGAPQLHPVVIRDQLFNYAEVYYRDASQGAINRYEYDDHSNIGPGFLFPSTDNLAPDAFAGQPGVTQYRTSTGVLVFAAKADGSLWYAHDTD